MITSKWCNENLNASLITWDDTKLELLEVLNSKSVIEVREELSDLLYFAYCFLHTKTGISLPMIGAKPTVQKVINRLDVWKVIFEAHNLTFNKKYLVNGSNYEKLDKVNKALKLAEKEQFNIAKKE